jgi:hypothetical protein
MLLAAETYRDRLRFVSDFNFAPERKDSENAHIRVDKLCRSRTICTEYA